MQSAREKKLTFHDRFEPKTHIYIGANWSGTLIDLARAASFCARLCVNYFARSVESQVARNSTTFPSAALSSIRTGFLPRLGNSLHLAFTAMATSELPIESLSIKDLPYPNLPENFNDDIKDEDGAAMSKR